MSTIHSADDDLLTRFLETDDVPLESTWHRDQMTLLVDLARFHHRDREDYYVGANMFVYWDPNDSRKSSGPDFMFIQGVPRWPERRIWAVWREEDRFPDLIVELMSPTTKNKDRRTNKTKYEHIFHTPEYFFYDPETKELQGWRLAGNRYQAISPNARGWFWSEELRLWLGSWYGTVDGREETEWLRFYDADGMLVPTASEAERMRAEAAEAEVARLRLLLLEQSSKEED